MLETWGPKHRHACATSSERSARTGWDHAKQYKVTASAFNSVVLHKVHDIGPPFVKRQVEAHARRGWPRHERRVPKLNLPPLFADPAIAVNTKTAVE